MNGDWKGRLGVLGETLRGYVQKTPSWLLGLIAIFLLLSLFGCASSPTQPTTVTVTKTQYLPVPATLTQRPQLPELRGETNADLYGLLLEYRKALLMCYGDKERIEQLEVPSR